MVATVVIIANIGKHVYIEHLSSLNDESLMYRFGRIMNRERIESYVNGISDDDYILACINQIDGSIACAAHLSVDDDNTQVEVGISTDLRYRRQGIAKKMMLHILAMCSNRNISQLYMTCLTDNRAIIKLCKSVGLAVVSSHGESQTVLELPSVSMASLGKELTMTNMVIADSLMKPFRSTWQQWTKGYQNDKKVDN
jgi:predicted acetyltransferase